jgi:putative Holliday junction resolvase
LTNDAKAGLEASDACRPALHIRRCINIRSMTRSRRIALDIGDRHIGIAVSDPLGITAQGLPTLQRNDDQSALKALISLAHDYDAAEWIVGLPLSLSGAEGRQAAKVRAFARQLQRRGGIPVVFWDERLSTVEAERVLHASGVSLKKRRAAVDRMSAVIILETYLESRGSTGS